MKKSVRLLLCGALAATALAGPSAYGDDPEDVGTQCVLVVTNDDTGMLSQDPNLRFGTLSVARAGVDVIDDSSPGPSHSTTTDETVHCWVQVNSDSPGHFPISSAHCDFPGHGVAAVSCQVEFAATESDSVYVCAKWDVTHAGSTQTTTYDDDGNSANGDQCALHTSVGPLPSGRGAAYIASGTITPGLTLTPTFQQYTMTITFMAGGSTNSGTATAAGCQFTGSSTAFDTVLVSQYSGTIGGCTTGRVTGTMSFTRVLSVVTYVAHLEVNGETYHVTSAPGRRSHGGGHCMYVSTSTIPETTYVVICDFVQ